MVQERHRWSWWPLAFAAAAVIFAAPAAHGKESADFVKDAEQYVEKGDLKAAEIELKNAVLLSPEDPAIRARLATVYLQLGDSVSAEREATKARDLNGNEADYLPVLTDSVLRQKKFSRLVELIKPDDREPILESRARTALGIAAVGLGQGEKAQEMLRDAIRLDPSAVRPRIQLAQLLNATDREAADQVIDAAIAADPRSAELRQAQGEILWSRGDAAGAIRSFDEALKIDPKNLAPRLARADINIAQGKFAAADQDVDPILQEAPDNFGANYLRGLEQYKQQQYTAADRTLDRISAAFPAFPAGFYLQGATKLALGQSAQAENALSQYLNRARGDQQALRLVAIAALRQQGAPRAIRYLQIAVQKLTPEAATLNLLGDAYIADGKPDLALQQFEKAASLDPANPASKTGIAISEIGIGSTQQGLADLEQVFSTEAGVTVAGPTLVLRELGAGNIDKAAEVATALVKRDADNPVYQRLLGKVKMAQRDYSGAETAFRAALNRNPQFAAAASDLGQLYVTTGRIDDATKLYNDLLEKNPKDLTALVGLADVAVAQQRWSDAIDLLNNARAAAKTDPSPGLKLVRLYESRRDWNSAKAVAVELSAQFPQNVAVMEASGRTQAEAGDTRAAVSSYKLAYQLAPNSPAIISRYAALLQQAKLFRDAWDVLHEGVARNPRNSLLKADLIRVDAELDGAERAVSQAQEYKKEDPDNGIYDLVSAEVYEKAGRTGDAAVLLEKAVQAHPADEGIAIALSRLYARGGDFAKAETLLTGQFKADKQDPGVGSALATLYLTTGRPDQAKKIYSGVLAAKPADIGALLGLADIAIAEMKWPEANDYIARARAAAPNDPAPGLKLIRLYAAQQDWRNAVSSATEMAKKFPGNLDVLDAKGQAEIAAGDINAAVSTYRSGYEQAPDSSPVLSRYLAVLGTAKQFDQERSVLEKAIDRNPRDASLKAELVRTQAESDGLDAALGAAQSFARQDPDNSLYDLVSAELYEKAGRPADGTALLEKALAAHPSADRLAIALAGLYLRTGEPAKAEAVLKNRLKNDPKNYDAGLALASFYSKQQRYAAAIAEYSRLLQEHPADAAVMNNLAWLYQRQGDAASARELAERAFSISPGAPFIIDTLGWVLLGQGEVDRALPYLATANLADPRSPDLQYHLAVALNRAGRPADARAMIERLLGSGASFADKAEAEKLLQELKRS